MAGYVSFIYIGNYLYNIFWFIDLVKYFRESQASSETNSEMAFGDFDNDDGNLLTEDIKQGLMSNYSSVVTFKNL